MIQKNSAKMHKRQIPALCILASPQSLLLLLLLSSQRLTSRKRQFHLNCQQKALLCKITSNPITKECNSGIRSYKSMPETQIPGLQNTSAERRNSKFHESLDILDFF